MEASQCKHFQTGYCKFREHCRKKHIIEMCQTQQCSSETCSKRHPKICKYFITFCKFGDKCCYKHVATQSKSKTLTDTKNIVAKLNSLKESINIISNQIVVLEKEIISIKKSPIIFKCDECGYEASSETVLKLHVTTKHKRNFKTPEIPI